MKIKTGTMVIAKVAIMGAKRGCGWRYSKYIADTKLASGYRFADYASLGMYPNKANEKWSAGFEQSYKDRGIVVTNGRPHQGSNAPVVIAD